MERMPNIDASSRYHNFSARFSAASRDIGACMALGMRDAMRGRLMTISAFSWLGAFLLCGVGFYLFRHDLLKTSAILAALLGFGAFSIVAGVLPAAALSGAATVSGMGMINPVALASFGASLLAAVAVFTVMVVLMPFIMYGIAMVLSMRVVLKFKMMARIQEQALKRYPGLFIDPSLAPGNRLLSSLLEWCKFAGCLVLCLILPALGALLVFLLLFYWNAYGLIDRALAGIASKEERAAIVKGQKTKLIVLGGASALLTFVPIVGLIGPAFTGASVSHFVMRRLVALRAAPALAITDLPGGTAAVLQ